MFRKHAVYVSILENMLNESFSVIASPLYIFKKHSGILKIRPYIFIKIWDFFEEIQFIYILLFK